MQLRRERILGVFRRLQPVALFIELFPFGRRKFTDELLPLLEAARADGPRAPVVLCSLRDILVNGRQDQERHDERASATANRFFDAILVHADPAFARLEESFAPHTPLAIPVHYTGFVVPPAVGRGNPPSSGAHVLVSAGGGLAGEPLLEAAVAAEALLRHTDAIPLRIVAGPFYPEESWRVLRAAARSQPGLSVRRRVSDLSAELRAARASVSQCGYNTALDLLRAEVPALVVPFGDAKENEQSDRARRLAQAGAVQVLDTKDLSPTALADAIRAVVRFRPRPMALDLEGARHTAELTAQLVHQRTARGAA